MFKVNGPVLNVNLADRLKETCAVTAEEVTVLNNSENVIMQFQFRSKVDGVAIGHNGN